MIPAFRTSGNGTIVYSANNVVNPTNLTPTKAAATQNGDTMICVATCRSNTATVATPAGWTKLIGPVHSGTASGGTIYVFARIADGGANDAPTIAWSGVTTGTSGDSSSAVIISYTGALAVLDGTPPAATDSSMTNTISLPAYTVVKRSLVIGVAMKIYDGAATWTVVSPYTERSDGSTTTGTGHSREVSDAVAATPGATIAATNATCTYTTAGRGLAITVGVQGAPTTVSRADPADIPVETGAAVAVTASKKVTITPAAETGAAVAVGAGHLKPAVTPALESGAAQTLSITHSTAQHRSLDPALESGAAQTITAAHPRTITFAADLSLTMDITEGRLKKLVSVAAAGETGASLDRTHGRGFPIAVALETGAAQPAGASHKLPAVTPAAETGAAQTIRPAHPRTIVFAAETDSGEAVKAIKPRTITFAAETGAGLDVKIVKPRTLTVAVEVDAGQDARPGHPRTLVFAVEASAAGTLVRGYKLDTAAETGAAEPLRAAHAAAVTPAGETAATLSSPPEKAAQAAAAGETDAALLVAAAKQLLILAAADTSAALAFAFSHGLQATPAAEADTARPLAAPFKRTVLEAALELDESLPAVGRTRGTQAIGSAGETDTAEALSFTKTVYMAIAVALEQAAAADVRAGHPRSITFALEVDTAGRANLPYRIGAAVETDRPLELSIRQANVHLLVPAGEVDTATQTIRVKSCTFTVADEVDSGVDVTAAKPLAILEAGELDSATSLRTTGGILAFFPAAEHGVLAEVLAGRLREAAAGGVYEPAAGGTSRGRAGERDLIAAGTVHDIGGV